MVVLLTPADFAFSASRSPSALPVCHPEGGASAAQSRGPGTHGGSRKMLNGTFQVLKPAGITTADRGCATVLPPSLPPSLTPRHVTTAPHPVAPIRTALDRNRIASHRITSGRNRIALYRIASYHIVPNHLVTSSDRIRSASHRIASHCIATYRIRS